MAVEKLKRPEIIARELEKIRIANDGILKAEDVVEAATPENSTLHRYFEWSNQKAAREYRLWQARQLISVSVTVVVEDQEPINIYVSLKKDRRNGGGYRTLIDVLKDDELSEQLLSEALDDFKVWEAKYKHLKALVPIIRAAAQIQQR